MTITEASTTTSKIEAKEYWEMALQQFPETNFLQSWNWGEFHHRLGKTVIRYCLLDEKEKITGLFQGVVETARRGRYLAIAGGPLIAWRNSQHLQECLTAMKDMAREHRCDFIRFRPQEPDSLELRKQLKALGVKLSPMHLTADLTLQLDLRVAEEVLLAQMRKQTRQAIRKATSVGITTRISTNTQELEEMYATQLALASKHHFVPFSFRFWQQQFEAFLGDDQVCLVHAQDQNGYELATAFIIFYNQEAVYHYGTSTPANDKLPGSYACQWAAILEAKRRGYATYNFWGVAPAEQPHHRFAGVSLFKRGFGGTEVAYLPAHDIPLTPKYWLNVVIETMRRKTRRL